MHSSECCHYFVYDGRWTYPSISLIQLSIIYLLYKMSLVAYSKLKIYVKVHFYASYVLSEMICRDPSLCPSVCLSICLSACLSGTLYYQRYTRFVSLLEFSRVVYMYKMYVNIRSRTSPELIQLDKWQAVVKVLYKLNNTTYSYHLEAWWAYT